MMEQLVHMYQKGAITADHLVVESFADSTRRSLPWYSNLCREKILERMSEYVTQYRPEPMRTNYGLAAFAGPGRGGKRWSRHLMSSMPALKQRLWGKGNSSLRPSGNVNVPSDAGDRA